MGLVSVAFDSEETKPEVVTQSFAVNFVVDQKQKQAVPFYEAVRMGLFDIETGEYKNNKTGERVSVGTAIKKGFLKGRRIESTFGLDIEAEDKKVAENIQTVALSICAGSPAQCIATEEG